jgi:hypothetical protein
VRQGYALLCDPAIANGFRLPWLQPLNLWTYWEAIKVPVLVLRAMHSDLLSSISRPRCESATASPTSFSSTIADMCRR